MLMNTELKPQVAMSLPPLFNMTQDTPGFAWAASEYGSGDLLATGLPTQLGAFDVERPSRRSQCAPVGTDELLMRLTFLFWSLTLQRSNGNASTATGPSERAAVPVDLNVTGYEDNDMLRLELASEVGDERMLVQIAQQMDWTQRSSADFILATRLALAAGACLIARSLAAQGAKLHPVNSELQKLSRLLAPPRLLRTAAASPNALVANQQWLRIHGAEHKGKWVALLDGVFLAGADSAQDMTAGLSPEQAHAAMITKVS